MYYSVNFSLLLWIASFSLLIITLKAQSTTTLTESSTIESISVFPVCTELFSNSTSSGKSQNSELCGAPGASSRLEPVTIITLAVTMGSKSFNDGGSDPKSSETFIFNGFPTTDLTKQQLNNFSPQQPCQQVTPPQNCTLFTQPLEVTVTTSPLAQRFRLREKTDNFPMNYLQLSQTIDYSEDDEEEEDEDDFTTDVCQCAYVRPGNTGGGDVIATSSSDKSNCDRLTNMEIGGKHATNYGHYLDDSCSTYGTLGILANYTFHRLNGNHIGGVCDKPKTSQCTGGIKPDYTPLFNCPGNSMINDPSKDIDGKWKRFTTPCQYCNIQNNDGSESGTCDDISESTLEKIAVYYNRGTIMACAGFLQNQANSISSQAVTLSGPCTSYIDRPLGSKHNRDPSTFPLSGKYTSGSTDGSQNTQGSCQVCIASYKSTSAIPGMFGSFRKCSWLIDDWRDSFAVLLSTNQNQGKGNLFLNSDGNSPTFDNQTFYYRSTAIYDNSGGSGVNEQKYKCCRFILPASAANNLLGRCTPFASGDYCFGSYNSPQDFVANKQTLSNLGDSNFPSGYEDASAETGAYQRGLALTPYFMDSASQVGTTNPITAHHFYRCGHYCSDFGKNSGTRSQNSKSEFDKGYVKGWAGLGPFCKAYDVDVLSSDLYQVYVTVTYQDSNSGANITETITLSSSSVLNGALTPATTRAGQSGLSARIVNFRTTSGTSANSKLGGVVVVCGATVKASSDTQTGQISGTLGPNITVASNPWNTLKLIQSNLVAGLNSGGARSIARAVPVPTFISLLQCFSFNTACLAPKDICVQAFSVCQNVINSGSQGGEKCTVPYAYIEYGSDPEATLQTHCTNSDTCLASDPTASTTTKGYFIKNLIDENGQYRGQSSKSSAGDLSDFKSLCQCCVLSNEDDDMTGSGGMSQPKGQAWFWLPDVHAKSFGPECGQYGMPLDYGKNENTAQYVCASPGDTVRCTPGFDDASVNTKSPCEIIGGLVNYYGKVSCLNSASQSPSLGSCYADETANDLSTCNSETIANVPIPEGLPTGFNPNAPRYWVDFFGGAGPALMYSPAVATTYEVEVELFVNGAALETDLINISPGKIYARPPIDSKIAREQTTQFCVFTRGSISGNSILPFYVQNTGSATADYIVKFDQCTGSAGFSPSDFIVDQSEVEVNAVSPGDTVLGSFTGSLSSSALLSTIQCGLSLYPKPQPNTLLESISIGCQITKGGSVTGTGGDGIDVDGSNDENQPRCAKYNLFCLLTYGSWQDKAIFYIFFGLSAFIVLVLFVVLVKANYHNTVTEIKEKKLQNEIVEEKVNEAKLEQFKKQREQKQLVSDLKKNINITEKK